MLAMNFKRNEILKGRWWTTTVTTRVGSCVHTRGICCWVSIDTLDQYLWLTLNWYLINTSSTLSQHLFRWNNFCRQLPLPLFSTIDRLSTNCQSKVYWDVDWVSNEFQLSVDQDVDRVLIEMLIKGWLRVSINTQLQISLVQCHDP